MFSHVFFGVSDFDRALSFYYPLMECLSIEPRFADTEKPWADWQTKGGRTLFVISKPYDGDPHDAGNGQIVAFLASSREVVRKASPFKVTKQSIRRT